MAPPLALPKAGAIVSGKYELVRLLGEGGMAYVFEATHQRLQQRVAMKILAPELARDAELVARFDREARAVAALRTRHVPRIMDVDVTSDGLPYIVMELLEGRDLDAELRARIRVPLDEAVDYVLQAAGAMAEAHDMGIVHRDLKPANLFLTRDGAQRIVKVLDFGVSKVLGATTKLTAAGAVMGTVLYMAPEQVKALPDVDTRADVWALGIILYELVAGRAPWDGGSADIARAIISKDVPDVRTWAAVPDGFAAVLHQMLRRDRAARVASVRDVLAALAPFAPASSIGAAVAAPFATGAHQRCAIPSVPVLTKSLPTHTVPMNNRLLVPVLPPEPRVPSVAQSVEAPRAAEPSDAPRRPLAGVALIASGFVVLGAVGLTLAFLAMRPRQPPAPAAAPVSVTSAEPDAGAASASSAVDASASEPAPPATGIVTGGSASGRRGVAGTPAAHPSHAPHALQPSHKPR